MNLRPLSLGEILDRTFTLYKSNIVLFAALAGIPRIPALALGLIQVQGLTQGGSFFSPTSLLVLLATYAVAIAGYVFAQGSSVITVSEIYLGRSVSIDAALRRVAAEFWTLLGVVVLNTLAIALGFLFLIVPGVILLCRLFVSVPVALIEGKGPGDTLSRSMDLTKGFAGRAGVIFLLFLALSLGFGLILELPLGLLALSKDPAVSVAGASFIAVANAIVEALLTPILLIATSIYYYDLRVRKEAFDLQMMMDPDGTHVPRMGAPSIVPEG